MHHTSRRMGDSQTLTELGAVLTRHTSETAAETKRVEEEYAAKWTAEKRKKAEQSGDALPGGRFPIVDQEDVQNAATLSGNSSLPRATVIAHIKKQVKKHGLKLPASLQSSDSS